jgi:hypothetical protein
MVDLACSPRGRAEVLHDRRVERGVLERLLAAVHGGQSGVLVVSGDPGIGKTALVESVIASASGFRVLAGRWVWSQRWSLRSRRCSSCARRCWIAWTGFRPRREMRSEWRSGCVRRTRRIGFGRVGGAEPCSRRRRRSSRLCAWLMTPSGLIGPRRKRSSSWRGGCRRTVCSMRQGQIEDSFRRRLARPPADTRRFLLVAAADPVGDPVVVWRAAGRLGMAVQSAADTDGCSLSARA